MKEPRQPRKRARQACLSCNQRRVKCDVTERRPCRNCEAADIPCEIRESRRGKHPRPSRHSVARSSISEGTGLPPSIPPATGGHTADHVEASHALASLARPGQQFEWRDNAIPVSEETISRDEQRHEDDGAVFLGESTSIRYVHEEPEASPSNGPSPENSRLRHSVPNAVKAESLIPQWEAERRKARINHLKSEGAFTVPEKPVLEALLGAYFRWFHPCFPVVDEKDVWTRQQQGNLSPLLMQALLFIGVIHCDEDILKDLGLGVRHRAKYIYYNRAKDIYDADHEQSKVTVIQALFLLSFWRAGALLEKDARHWLGAAISLAQTKALHRSSNSEGKLEKLRKRVWWAIYVRERQCAAALGLPHRIRDEDCDIEPLERSDFERAFNTEAFPGESEEWISYVIGTCGLARILGRVVHSGYLPHKHLSPTLISQLKDELIRWKQLLPPTMQLENDFGNRPGFHANMLHLAYNNILILLYRSAYMEAGHGNGELDSAVALQAAARNSRIIEDMLPDGKLRHLQIHCITNLFNTLCIHALHLRRSEGTARAIAEHRAKLCLMGLQELQKTWEVTNWVLQLFFQYLDRSTAARLQLSDESIPGSSPERTRIGDQLKQSVQSNSATPTDLNGMAYNLNDGLPGGPGLAGDTPWSWSTEEANQFLFSQIENDFSFGEGSNQNYLDVESWPAGLGEGMTW